MSDFLDVKRREINQRLKELQPLVAECQQLEAAAAALKSVDGGAASSSRATRGRPAKRGGSTGRRRPGRRRGSGTRGAQALSLVIPPLVNTFIGTFKDTSLVIIIGLFDLLGTVNAALADAEWQGFSAEAYIFAALIYFAFCFFMSRYSVMLEREFNRGRRR